MPIVKFFVLFLCVYTVSSHESSWNFTGDNNVNIDEIPDLPLTEYPSYWNHGGIQGNMYAGFLPAGSNEKFMYYWLNKQQERPLRGNKLLIWLNGGPGCSSLFGLFKENGPFTFFENNSTLKGNPWAWDKFAHTLYLEAPLGVGFSHRGDGMNTTLNDEQTVDDMLDALAYFFRIHTVYDNEYEYWNFNFEIYLSGESYAGVYVPLLAQRALQRGNSVLARQLKGIILGNPVFFDQWTTKNVAGKAKLLYENGLIDRKYTDFFQRMNCFKDYFIGGEKEVGECEMMWYEFATNSTPYTYDEYNVGKRCYNNEEWHALMAETDETIAQTPKCEGNENLEAYLNRNDTQLAFRVRTNEYAESQPWKACRMDIRQKYQTGGDWATSRKIIKDLINTYGQRVLLYYGDLDSVCDHYTGEWFVKTFGWKQNKYRRSDFGYRDESERWIASGWAKTYKKLTFAVIMGAGHTVPKDKPAAIFRAVRDWLEEKKL